MANYLITGCSGGGKSALIAALAAQGLRTVAEPGRRLIAQGVTPWGGAEAFLRAAAKMALADLADHRDSREPVFYDRGLIDAAAGLERLGRGSARDMLEQRRPYEATVFLAPPWPEIFRTNDERRHSFDDAVEEYRHLERLLPELGYLPVVLPPASVPQRVRFVREALDA